VREEVDDEAAGDDEITAGDEEGDEAEC